MVASSGTSPDKVQGISSLSFPLLPSPFLYFLSSFPLPPSPFLSSFPPLPSLHSRSLSFPLVPSRALSFPLPPPTLVPAF
jgi:hypothetical protein